MLSPTIINGNFSRDVSGHLWGGNLSSAIAVMGTSRDTYCAVRTVGYVTSGVAGLVLRFNENSNKSRQYYQFRINPTSDFVAVEEVNVSTVWNAPTLLQSRSYTSVVNISSYLGFDCTAINDSQDKLRAWVNNDILLQYEGTLSLSSGKSGIIVQSGEVRFDKNTVVGEEIDSYCSVQDVKDLIKGLGVSEVTDEGEIQGLITRFSAKINDDTGTVFGRLAKIQEERHQGGGEEAVQVDHIPLKILSQLDIYNYNNALVVSYVPGHADWSNLIIEDDIGLITLPPKSVTLTPIYGVGLYPVEGRDDYTYRQFDYTQYFGVGRRNIKVNYLYGYDDIPHDVWDCCRKMVGVELLTKIGNYNTQGISSLRLGDASETYGVRGPFSGTIEKYEKDIEEILADYETISMATV